MKLPRKHINVACLSRFSREESRAQFLVQNVDSERSRKVVRGCQAPCGTKWVVKCSIFICGLVNVEVVASGVGVASHVRDAMRCECLGGHSSY
mmetsp:Transcript_40815/g.69756  ORF Transcript_40815/g.69756 Transcript_40815/m.69756 type:complete len:93 (-) Transcript_40815:1083-1361(-)